ncbi:MAG TPA: hypothetical protein VGA56_22160 [Opitutaceae bacterium]
MFIGHYAVALVARSAAPRASLGVLFGATQLPDLVWPVCVLLGWEHVEIVPGITAFNPLEFTSHPWSHSLLMVTAWGALAGLAYHLLARDRAGAAAVVFLAISHWVLDWVSHRPDLPVWPGGMERLGLGLWNSIPGTLLVEGSLFFAGAAMYLRRTHARDRIGRYGFWSLLVVLVAAYIADRFGPPPPSERVLGWFALFAGWLPVLWAGWADGHRSCTIPAGKES